MRLDQLRRLGDAHAATSAGTRPSSSSLATTSARALLRLVLLGVDHELRARRLLVRVRDAGELLDLALERLLVEALHVAPRALVDRGLDVDLDERADLLDQLARLLPRRLVRRDRGRDHGAALAREPRRDPADRARCSCRGPPSRSPRPFERCVRTVSPSRYSTTSPRRSSSGPTRCAIVVLPGAGEPGEPEREAAGPDVRRLRVLGRVDVVVMCLLRGVSRWMPHSSLSEPAQRPARSSSSGVVGRVHGMHPIERKPTSWSGLYGISLTVDVGPDALLVPVGERVQLPDLVALRPLHLRRGRAARRLVAADPGDPGVVGLERVQRAARPCGCGSSGRGRSPRGSGPPACAARRP